MDWLAFDSINWWGVLLATLSTFAVGFVWYAEGLFGKEWMGLVGITEMEMGDPNPLIYVFTMVGSLIAATGLALLMAATDTEGWGAGLVFGLVVGLVFRVTSHVMHNGFAMKSGRLTMIDGLHDVVQTGVMGLIIGLF
jgi:hypothetical protein